MNRRVQFNQGIETGKGEYDFQLMYTRAYFQGLLFIGSVVTS